jgi:hypothetical protein
VLKKAFKENELKIFKSICHLIEFNTNNNNKVNINYYTLSKDSGVSYNTVRNKIKQLKEVF